MTNISSSYKVAVFAYNEERNITRCIESIISNSDQNLSEIVVLANGCTDRTVDRTKLLAKKHALVKIIEIDEGDKCNAWNSYVYELATDEDKVHFFTDGDCTFTGDAFSILNAQLLASSKANAAAAIPMSGRHRKQYLKLLQDRHCLFGNCYALKHEFILTIRNSQFQLPKGLLWIDSAITKAVNSDLIDQNVGYDNRIIYNLDCGYKFDSLRPFSPPDIRLFYSRLARYRAGKIQEQYLAKLHFHEWPRDLSEINKLAIEDIDKGKTRLPLLFKQLVRKKLASKIYE